MLDMLVLQLVPDIGPPSAFGALPVIFPASCIMLGASSDDRFMIANDPLLFDLTLIKK